MTQTRHVILKPGRERSLRLRHPWVFSGAIARVEGGAQAGQTVDVLDANDEFLARAAYSPASQIRARVWTFDRQETVDREFFMRRLERAILARAKLGLPSPGGACRLVFAEADGLPGLIVDRYADYVVCQFSSVGPELWRDTIVECLVELVTPVGIFERSESGSRRKEGLSSRQGVLHGAAPPAIVTCVQDGVTTLVDLVHGQKTGAYLDQQSNRRRVAAHAHDADVLDAFAYSGSLAIASLKAGARSATLIESSGEALRLADQSAAMNGVAERCRYVEGDVFTILRELRATDRSFDLVILDPPKFVHSAAQLKSGSRGYKDINWLSFQLVRPGGMLATFSCSGHVDAALFQKIVAGAALDAGRDVQIVEQVGQPADHPIALRFPEGAYLKGLLLRVW